MRADDMVVAVTEGVSTLVHDRRSDATVLFDAPEDASATLLKYGLDRTDVDELWLLDRESNPADVEHLCRQPERDDPLRVVAAVDSPEALTDDPQVAAAVRHSNDESTGVETVLPDGRGVHAVGDLRPAMLGRVPGSDGAMIASVATPDRPFAMVLRGETDPQACRNRAGEEVVKAAFDTAAEAYELAHGTPLADDEVMMRLPAVADHDLPEAVEPTTAYQPIPISYADGDAGLKGFRRTEARRFADHYPAAPAFATADSLVRGEDVLDRAAARVALTGSARETAMVVDALDVAAERAAEPERGA